MKKIFTLIFCILMVSMDFAQWNPATMRGEKLRPNSNVKNFYSLDLKQLRASLSSAEETGKNAKAVIINLPTLDGKTERFAVYSFPVMVKSLADQYNLGSYVGVGVDDPSKYVRFSVALNDFQSMIIKDGAYEFIEPQNTDKSVYGVHAKTKNTGEKPFLCSTSENIASKEQMNKLFKNGKSLFNQPTNFTKSSDRKYRTLRLAISTTGEYTSYFGGVAGALTAINATMTRVNGVFENEFSVHLILQNYPSLIYTDANTDPYSPASTGAKGKWNGELMNTLHANPGDNAFDIGHLFGATGGGGNAGCIGCVCNNTLSTGGGADDSYKGSAFTSPADAKPFGDTFDIDYVAHEMGHQLGGNHTFSFQIENAGVNIEPGSGSTIMGYAGITNSAGQPNTDVQAHSDAYFSVASLIQIQNNLVTRACATITSIPNNPPIIAALSTYNIPKGTAFVLTASATDPENDPITYDWEQVDSAQEPINENNLGLTLTGASFRSKKPSSNPVRYFPALNSVLAGVLDNSLQTWESVSKVARKTNFRITVRDNSISNPGYLQTQNALQTIIVGNDGPFSILSQNIYKNLAGPVTWDVANTSATPYLVANVKIDYTVDNGNNWIILSASTPNDGSENFSFPSLLIGSKVKLRIGAIGNFFYTIKELTVNDQPAACDGTPPKNITFNSISFNSVKVLWDPTTSATYIARYRKIGAAEWIVVNTSVNFINLTNLVDNVQYEFQVATVCSGTAGNYSVSQNFTTLLFSYCANASSSSNFEYISKVEVLPLGGVSLINNSGPSNYTSYAADASKIINLKANTSGNILNVTKAWSGTPYNESVYAWVDFNRNGIFEDSEQIMSSNNDQTTVATTAFSVPANAYTGNQPLGMRVILSDQPTQSSACAGFQYGEVEDYSVKITGSLSVNDVPQNEGLQIYPNPASDVLNITKVSNNAIYSIYNMSGQIAAKGNIRNNKVQVSGLLKGIYIISIDNNGETTKVKFIKK
ncbi:reprolysin-like metallopeptidase [Halpernia sp. GG3]